METKLAFVDRLLMLERRVCRIYRNWAANERFPADLRSFWGDMAEDEKQHITTLERSAGLLNFAVAPLDTSTAQIEKIEAKISSPEGVSDEPELSVDQALSHAIALEGSELNQLDNSWLEGFHPDLGKLLQAWTPAHEEHIRRLSDAVYRFARNENLHKEASALLSEYERQQTTQG